MTCGVGATWTAERARGSHAPARWPHANLTLPPTAAAPSDSEEDGGASEEQLDEADDSGAAKAAPLALVLAQHG